MKILVLGYKFINNFVFLFLPVEYSDLKKDPQHYCEVRAEIKGLEKKLLGKANAEINLDLTERYLNGHYIILCICISLQPPYNSTFESYIMYQIIMRFCYTEVKF